MENRKRKRDPENGTPRITYHVEQLGRSFERIFKEDSHEELRNVVRKKLKLDDNTHLDLVQLRDGRMYDLEDDDDFEAFKAAAYEYSSLDVRVSFSPGDLTSLGRSSAGEVSVDGRVSVGLDKPRRKKRKKSHSVPTHTPQDESTARPSSAQPVVPSGDNEDMPASPKKRRKKDVQDSPRGGRGAVSKAKNSETENGNSGSMPKDQTHDVEPPKKKRKHSKEVEANASLREDPLPLVSVEAVSTAEKSIKRKKKKVDIAISSQDANDIQFQVAETPTPSGATSIPLPGASAGDADAPSSVPSLQSALLEFTRLPSRTPEEIAALYEETKADKAKTSKAKTKKQAKGTATANNESKQKEGKQSKIRRRKSRLSESWVPGDIEGMSDKSHPEAAATSSGSAQLPLTDTARIPAHDVAASVVLSSVSRKPQKPQKSPSLSAPTPCCPVCLSRPFHLRYQCPIIKSGMPAIKARIAELDAEGGWENLINELQDWVPRKESTTQTKGVPIEEAPTSGASQSPGLKSVFSWGAKAERRRDSSISGSERVSVGPQEGQLSEVTVENRGEGSEEETSSESSGDGNEIDKKTDESESESESEPESQSSSELGTGQTTKSPIVNLEDVDLEALIRGPPLNLELEKIGDEYESNNTEDGTGLLEEEEQEQKPRRRKGWQLERYSSPEGVDDEGDESEPEPEPDDFTAVNNALVSSAGDKQTGPSSDSSTDAHPGLGSGVPDAEVTLAGDAELQRALTPDTASISQEAAKEATKIDVLVPEPPATPPADEPPRSFPTVLPPATSADPSTSLPMHHLRSPIVQQMKDRSGALPLNPPDDEIGAAPRQVSPGHGDISSQAVEVEAEPRKRGRPRASSQTKPTAHATRSRSRTAALPSSSTTPTSSGAAPKRRGRPPLSEAVKAERQAIKDAAKAVRIAQRDAKIGGKKSLAARKQTVDAEVSSFRNETDPPSTSTPVPASQWNTLDPTTGSSAISRSSPAIDQLMPSSPAVLPMRNNVHQKEVPEKATSIRSPETVSVTTSASRRLDEDDVEHILGSPKASKNQKVLPLQSEPLFLPGASQMTQPQTISRFSALVTSEQDSNSSSDTDTDTGDAGKNSQKPTVSRPARLSESTVPSLSQLSFDKFRSGLLLKGIGLMQNKPKEPDVRQFDEESESDDESSDEEGQSHIPKGRLAGVGVVRKRASRGLLGV